MSRLTENVDYCFIPHESLEDAWAVRIMSGDFIETVIAYNAIAFNEVKDCLTYNFVVVSSPDDNAVDTNEELQQKATEILEAIIEAGIEDGTVELKERDADKS